MNTSDNDDRIDEVAAVVRDLRERIARHGLHLGGHETRTRVLLIDPILNSLGWDVVDPNVVEFEAPNETGRPDYVLRVNGEPFMVIEAKAFGKLKVAEAAGQVANYIWQESLAKADTGILTDGDHWHLRRKPDVTKSIKPKIKISDDSVDVYKVALDLHRNLARSNFPPDLPLAEVVNVGATTITPPPGDWFAIDDEANFPQDKAPAAIRINGGDPIPANGWSDMCAEVAKFVVQHGHLKDDQVPLKDPRGTRYLINRSPVNSNGTEFRNKRQFVDGFWIDTWGGRQVLPGKSQKILRAAGLEPSDVQVRFG